MKKRQRPTLSKVGSGAVTCYKPRREKPSLEKVGSGAVTCYKPRKK